MYMREMPNCNWRVPTKSSQWEKLLLDNVGVSTTDISVGYVLMRTVVFGCIPGHKRCHT